MPRFTVRSAPAGDHSVFGTRPRAFTPRALLRYSSAFAGERRFVRRTESAVREEALSNAGIALAALVVGVATGCAQATPATPQGRPSPTASERPRHELVVVVEGLDGTPESPSALDLCSVGRSVFFCQAPIIERHGRLVADRSIASEFGSSVAYTGRSVSDIWSAHRGSDDRVKLRHFDGAGWRDRDAIAVARTSGDLTLSNWTPGCVVFLQASPLEDLESKTVRPLVMTAFGRNCPPVPNPRHANGRRALALPFQVYGFDNGSLVLSGMDLDGRVLLEVWADANAESTLVEASSCATTVQVFSAEEFVSVGADPSGPCGRRYRRGQWKDLSLPRGDGAPNATATSYTQEPAGTEWCVIETGNLRCGAGCHRKHRGELWRRRPGERWNRVRIPPPRLPHGTPQPIQPLAVLALRDGDVWVRGHYFDVRARDGVDRGVLLHTDPYPTLCGVEAEAINCLDSAR